MFRKVVFTGLFALSSGAGAQNVSPAIVQATDMPKIVPALLRRDTPIVLMAINEVSTANATPGTMFKLRVNEPVSIDGKVIIPVGTPATGRVIAAEDSGGLGKSGRMTAKLLHVMLGDAEIPLEGEMSAKGTGAGSAGVAVIFTGVVGLFHRGNNAKIKAGEIVSGFVGEDVFLDLSSTPIKRVVATPATAVPGL